MKTMEELVATRRALAIAIETTLRAKQQANDEFNRKLAEYRERQRLLNAEFRRRASEAIHN